MAVVARDQALKGLTPQVSWSVVRGPTAHIVRLPLYKQKTKNCCRKQSDNPFACGRNHQDEDEDDGTKT